MGLSFLSRNSLIRIQQDNIVYPGRPVQGLASPELVRKVRTGGNFHCQIRNFQQDKNDKKELFCLKTEKGPGKHFVGRNEYMAVWAVTGSCSPQLCP